jgi:oligoribonuclease
VFVPVPGPDTESARAIAEKHGGALTGLPPEPLAVPEEPSVESPADSPEAEPLP